MREQQGLERAPLTCEGGTTGCMVHGVSSGTNKPHKSDLGPVIIGDEPQGDCEERTKGFKVAGPVWSCCSKRWAQSGEKRDRAGEMGWAQEPGVCRASQ